jgi:hypothetical protein
MAGVFCPIGNGQNGGRHAQDRERNWRITEDADADFKLKRGASRVPAAYEFDQVYPVTHCSALARSRPSA